jgi:hypothetical protein
MLQISREKMKKNCIAFQQSLFTVGRVVERAGSSTSG